MATNSLPQETPTLAHHYFYRWFMLRRKANVEELTRTERKQMGHLEGSARRSGGDAYVLALAWHRGLMSAEQWEVAKWSKRLPERFNLNRVLFSKLIDYPFDGSNSKALTAQEWAINRCCSESVSWLYHQLLLAEGKEGEAAEYLRNTPKAGVFPVVTVKEPKEPKVQRVEAQSAPEPSGSYMEIWMAIFARLRELSNEREQACCEETEPESAPLPDGAVLADLVGYALAHDLGLLVGGN